MPVTDQHPSYSKYFPQWEITRDCAEGSKAVKAKKSKYLPMPNSEDTSPENKARYSDYVERANFVSFTGNTLTGMLGMVFTKPITQEVQQAIEYLKSNANGGGLTLDQMARSLISNVIQTGRYGLLVDYPPAPANLSKAEVEARKLQANILPYAPEKIINWRTEMAGSIKRLSMVVLQEDHEVIADDGFGVDVKKYHRVLKLTEGTYTQQLYDDKNEVIGELLTPTKSDGSEWDEIPFVFIGSENNDETVDKGPLYDIAEINIAHYRNSADFEESSFMVGQPTPVIAGLTQSWVKEVLKGGVMLGSRTAVLLPENASADLLQANPNSMPEAGMESKEKQMVKVGARIIQDSGGTETAEAARIRFGGQNSQLGTIVGNVEAGLMACIGWAMLFMGASGENSLGINKDFYDLKADPQLIMAEIQLFDRGLIAKPDMRNNLRKTGVIENDRTDEQIDEDAEGDSGDGAIGDSL